MPAFDNLPHDFRGRTLEGDVLASGRAASAPASNRRMAWRRHQLRPLNAVVATWRQAVYKVRNVVVRNYDPR